MLDLQVLPAGIHLTDSVLDVLEQVGIEPRVQFNALDTIGWDVDVKFRKVFVGAVDQPILFFAQKAIPLQKR